MSKIAYGNATGPLGFPMTDRQAFALDEVLKQLPRDEVFRYRKAMVPKSPTELLAGDRCDVSWISEESPDRDREVVIAAGMNDRHFQLNPIVTLNHAYDLPPVGRSLWRKRVRDGQLHGIKAKTHYPSRPADWSGGRDWPPDAAFALVQADLLRGKSIGFLPTKVHPPTEAEHERLGWQDVRLVIDEWILLEYACVYLPAQQHAVLEAVSKGKNQEPHSKNQRLFGSWNVVLGVPFTPVVVISQRIADAVAAIDPVATAARVIDERIDQLRGRV